MPIYTIGYGNRKTEEFLRLLLKYNIKYLIDVRSHPISKFNPEFSRSSLNNTLAENGIKYVFMGDSIGGRPIDISCYDIKGKVDYNIVAEKDFFKKGIERLRTAYKKDIPVVIMCSEANPCDCHRSKLIGKVLSREKILLQHIDENGLIQDQVKVMNKLNKGFSDTDLFGSLNNSTSRKSYL